MKNAIIQVKVPEYQIGKEVNIYFKDTMMIKGIVQELNTERIEYGTDGNSYKITISNGKEFEQEPCEDAISREAAIKICEERGHDNSAHYIRELPPVQPKIDIEDAISRKAVHEVIDWWFDILKQNPDILQDAITTLPSVNPQPKTGHWIGIAIQGELDGQIVKAFTCSKCGAISVFRMTGGKIVNGDICPNCGAKMVDEQKRSDKE